MILTKTPVSLVHVREYVKDVAETKPIVAYVKKFCELSAADAENLTKEISALNNPKISEGLITKVIDFLPRDSEELNKLFLDVSLTEEESHAILTLVKKY